MFKPVILFLMFNIFFVLNTSAAGITTYEPLNAAKFWQKNNIDGDKVVLSPDKVKVLNKDVVRKSNSVYDLKAYSEKQSGATIKKYIAAEDRFAKDTLYLKGVILSANYKNIVASETNLKNVKDEQVIRYGVVIRRSNLRAMPTNEGWFYFPSDKSFDQLQETAVDPNEPVIILHESKSGNFYFVQMRNYRGWIARWNVALTDRSAWLKNYVEPKQFLVVTGSKYLVNTGKETIFYQMGAKISVAESKENSYSIIIPGRNTDGSLLEKRMTVNKTADINFGFLSYTRNNILMQAFKYVGVPYGWGGLNNSVDCSSFIANVYRSVGIDLPRDADEQELTAGVNIAFTGLSQSDRKMLLTSVLKPGDVLFFEGHTMLYLGMTQNIPYVIHSLGSYYENGQKKSVMKVVVSDLSLRKANNVDYLNSLTSAMSYR